MYCSIIICTYNRVEYLIETITSLTLALHSESDYEVLVIDNNSNDSTGERVKSAFGEHPKVRYVLEIKQGLSNARNRGLKEATGEIILFVDDDIEIQADYFSKLETAFEDPNVNVLGGKVLPFKVDVPEWLPSKYYYLVSIFDLGNQKMTTPYVMGANYAMRKKVADEVGFYDVNLGRKGDNLMAGEETDYLDRAQKIGYGVHYIPELVVYHKINDKLNTKYVYNYAYLNGKSNAIQYKNQNALKYIAKYGKSLAMLGFASTIGAMQSNITRKTYFTINKFYSLGYLGIKADQ